MEQSKESPEKRVEEASMSNLNASEKLKILENLMEAKAKERKLEDSDRRRLEDAILLSRCLSAAEMYKTKELTLQAVFDKVMQDVGDVTKMAAEDMARMVEGDATIKRLVKAKEVMDKATEEASKANEEVEALRRQLAEMKSRHQEMNQI